MPKTHLRFKNFRVSTLEAAAALFEAKPWRLGFGSDEQVAIAQTFVDAVSASNHVPTAEVVISQAGYSPASYTTAIVRANSLDQIESISPPKIHLSRWSIVSLFIAVRTHLLSNGAEQVSGDPKSWAHSLFYNVKPVQFRARAREGRISGVTAEDTFSRETWAKLVAAGVGDNYTGTLTIELDELPTVLAAVLDGSYVAPEVSETADDDDEDEWDGPNDNLADEDEFDEPADVTSFLGADDADNFTDEGERLELEHGASEGDHPELDHGDGLDGLGIVALRRLSRGVISGGYSLGKPELIAKLRENGIQAAV